MTSIGLRVYSNSKIYYCVVEKDVNGNIAYRDISYLVIPKALKWPEALTFTRYTILDILNQYEIKTAIIRICEYGTTFSTNILERCYIEGVLQESIASSSVDLFLAGQISEFTSLLRIPKEDFKKYANGELEYRNIPDEFNWANFSLETRETILTANAALNL